ncbi:MAG: hypothetical protein ABSG76_21865 [Xanthobacteraceae bacterium]|jgi:hypothetical protein
MPRYYFHLKSKVPSEDEDGIDLADVAAARAEATRFAQELVKVHQSLREAPTSGEIIVTDELGEEILTLSVSVPPRQDPSPLIGHRTPETASSSGSPGPMAEG